MVLALFFITLAPVKAQESYTIKERVDDIYEQVKETQKLLNMKFETLQKEMLANRERINRLEIYIWFVGLGAVALGSVLRELLIKGIRKANGIGMEKVNWKKK
jgi:uncharacterized protein YaaN involved in tellurite resistance